MLTIRRSALAASAAGLLLSGWAGVLDPGTASADAPWWPGEPPALPCDDEGLTPGTQCVESSWHVKREHTYVFDVGIWGNMGNLACHQPPYIDPIGPGTGGLFDSNGILIAAGGVSCPRRRARLWARPSSWCRPGPRGAA